MRSRFAIIAVVLATVGAGVAGWFRAEEAVANHGAGTGHGGVGILDVPLGQRCAQGRGLKWIAGRGVDHQ